MGQKIISYRPTTTQKLNTPKGGVILFLTTPRERSKNRALIIP